MNCEACGQSVSQEDLFCDECGARLQEPEPTVEANQSPAQRETNVEDQQSATAPLDRPGPDAVEGFETLSWSSTMLRAITDDLTLRGISWQSKNGRLEVPATAVEYLKAAIDEHPNTRSSEVHTSANDYDEPASVETTTEDGAPERFSAPSLSRFRAVRPRPTLRNPSGQVEIWFSESDDKVCIREIDSGEEYLMTPVGWTGPDSANVVENASLGSKFHVYGELYIASARRFVTMLEVRQNALVGDTEEPERNQTNFVKSNLSAGAISLAAPEELTELEAPRDHSDLSAREFATQSELLGAQNRNEVGGAGPQKTNAAPDTPEGTRSSDVQQTQVKSQQQAKNRTIGAIAAALIVVAAVGAILVAGAGNNDSSSSERPNPPSEAAGTGNYRCDRIRSIASEFQSSGATFDDKYWLTLEAADLMPRDWQSTANSLRDEAKYGLWGFVPGRFELFLRNSDYC